MSSRSAGGRYSPTCFSRSRNFVTVRRLVSICWRNVAMVDYSRRMRGFKMMSRTVIGSFVARASTSMKRHIDPEKVAIKKDADEKLPGLMDYGDEEDFVRAVK